MSTYKVVSDFTDEPEYESDDFSDALEYATFWFADAVNQANKPNEDWLSINNVEWRVMRKNIVLITLRSHTTGFHKEDKTCK